MSRSLHAHDTVVNIGDVPIGGHKLVVIAGPCAVESREQLSRAAEAVKKLGLDAKYESIRGGTDGSRLSEMGLPTPNLSCGMHNFHSPLEFACLDQMETGVKVLIELSQLWGKEK